MARLNQSSSSEQYSHSRESTDSSCPNVHANTAEMDDYRDSVEYETFEIDRLLSKLPDSWKVLDTEGYFKVLRQLFEAAYRLRRLSIGVDIEPSHAEKWDYFKLFVTKFGIDELHHAFVSHGLLPGLQYEPAPGIPHSVLETLRLEDNEQKWLSMNRHWRKSSLSRTSPKLIQLEMKQQYYRDLLMSYMEYLFRDESVTQTELIYKFIAEQNGLYEGRRQSIEPFKDEVWQQLRAKLDYKISAGTNVCGGKFVSMATPVKTLHSLLASIPVDENASHANYPNNVTRSPKRRIVSAGTLVRPMKKSCLD